MVHSLFIIGPFSRWGRGGYLDPTLWFFGVQTKVKFSKIPHYIVQKSQILSVPVTMYQNFSNCKRQKDAKMPNLECVTLLYTSMVTSDR